MHIEARIKICTKKPIIILWSYSHHSKKKTIAYDYNMFAHRPGLCYCCEPQGLYDDVIKWFAMRIYKFIKMKKKKQPPVTA